VVSPTYPGVYVQEVPSGVHTITGVSTSVGAFIDYFPKGTMNKAVQVLSFADFERTFGGLDTLSEASYAIQQFFLNGGTNAWVVRVAAGTPVASTGTVDNTGGTAAFTVYAVAEGTWGDDLKLRVDWDTTDPANYFNLYVEEYVTDKDGNKQLGRTETWRNLSLDSSETRYLVTVIDDEASGSDLIFIDDTAGAVSGTQAQPNGTLSGDLSAYAGLAAGTYAVDLTISGTPGTATMTVTASTGTTLDALRALLESAIRASVPANTLFASATVTVTENRLLVLAGPGDADATVVFSDSGADTTASTLLLTSAAGATETAARYGLTGGNDGSPPDAAALIGDRAAKSGIYAFEDVDIFNLMCIPRIAMVSGDNAIDSTGAAAVTAVAEAYCEERRAFLLLDTPNNITEPNDIRSWLSDNIRDTNAALFYPRVRTPDPLDEYRLRSVGASGTVAGLHARIDGSRGVWKAAAGTEASLRNVQALDYPVTDAENGVLNPLAINCIRNFPGIGTVSWGARTLDGADVRGSEWKYIPIRRLALYIEESLRRGIQWAVFEPNDEPLWAQLRLNVGTFMQNLFRQGAFEGATPKDAYFVRCDGDTTTASDRDRGIVNVWVGFAPLKPAEFVVLYLQQKTAEAS
jgi:phage tail sheath protein FI